MKSGMRNIGNLQNDVDDGLEDINGGSSNL